MYEVESFCHPFSAGSPAILFVVAWNMSEAKHFIRMIRRAPRADVVILLITFGLTVFVDLIVAVNIGVILATLHFLSRMSLTVEVTELNSRDLSRDVVVGVYLEGYRSDVPFAQMPKIRISIGRGREQGFNQLAGNPGAGITVTRKEREVTIRCPLRGLGYPEKLMTSARSYLAEVPLDWMSWRIIENLPREPRKLP